MHYVTRWRMYTALTWLKENDGPIGELARRLDYESEAAFSRAFKRYMGIRQAQLAVDEIQPDPPHEGWPFSNGWSPYRQWYLVDCITPS